MDDVSTLISRIDALLDRPRADGDADVLAHMETTLTDGYAHALALEAEHWRLQKRIAALAGELSDEHGELRTAELVALARRLKLAEAELDDLRGVLAPLRARIALARDAA